MVTNRSKDKRAVGQAPLCLSVTPLCRARLFQGRVCLSGRHSSPACELELGAQAWGVSGTRGCTSCAGHPTSQPSSLDLAQAEGACQSRRPPSASTLTHLACASWMTLTLTSWAQTAWFGSKAIVPNSRVSGPTWSRGVSLPGAQAVPGSWQGEVRNLCWVSPSEGPGHTQQGWQGQKCLSPLHRPHVSAEKTERNPG